MYSRGKKAYCTKKPKNSYFCLFLQVSWPLLAPVSSMAKRDTIWIIFWDALTQGRVYLVVKAVFIHLLLEKERELCEALRMSGKSRTAFKNY